MEVTGWRALYDSAFALALLSVTALIALAAGLRTMRALAPLQGPNLEGVLFSLGLGLAILAYGIFALGMMGLFTWWAMAAWALALAVWARREMLTAGDLALQGIANLGEAWRRLTSTQRLVVLAWVTLFSIAVLQALAPPWDYDGLMYHLQGPRLFLQAGRVLFLADNWQANGPFTVEMLFGLGLSLGSDSFAKLLHVGCAVLLVLSAFVLGRRGLGSSAGWITIALMAGVPLFSFWASLAYADMAWALYQTLMLVCLLRWEEDHQRGSLALAGLFAGLAAGCKYLGLSAVALGGLWLVWKVRGQAWREAVKSAAAFCGVAIAVAAPWYLKNWFMAGNPVFPFLFGGPAWDKARLQLLMDYLGSFGIGQSPLDYLRLPWNLFVHSQSFGTFMRALEVPNVLFLFAFLYPLGRRTRAADAIAALAACGFMLWSAGSQQVRFLLPLFPLFAVTAASVILRVGEALRPHRWAWAAGAMLVAVPVGLAIFWSGFLIWYARPGGVIAGLESKRAFLERRVPNFRAMEFVDRAIPETGRVLMLWDGEGYYCDTRCLPDTDQSQWPRLAANQPDPDELAHTLRSLGVTHLLYSRDSDVLVEERDPRGVHRGSREYLFGRFRERCAVEIYGDEWVSIYELRCADPA